MFNPDKSIYAYLMGDLNTWEVRELIQWINDSPENKRKFKAIREYWENSNDTITLEKANIDRAYNKLSRDIFKDHTNGHQRRAITLPRAKSYKIAWMSLAASVVLALGVFFLMNLSHSSKEINALAMIIKENPKGRKSQIFLPDGTKVWLNAESKVEYQEGFGHTHRNIKLHGEAYFDIEKNKELPFIVKTSKVSITALGTEFNVRSYLEEASIDVLLTEGKVVISDLDRINKDEYLEEGESLSYSKSEKKFEKNLSEFENLLAWRNGILSFHEASQEEVFRTLERWYGVKLIVKNRGSNQEWKYTSRFENESLENVLISMGHVKKFDFIIRNETVILNYRK
ncbi:FecR domain-containing protein [Reichenbachiella sp. MALMAid0571]|uniref:FecR family protein n=1 Tax=Reichenbachiella sp. MALMAid0571 TaxID=3143939 RepID=UPI0032DE30A9